MAETKNKGLGVPETKGSFQLMGVVTGTEKKNFYSEMTTKTNKPMRMVNFGVNIEDKKTVWIALNSMERDKVYFLKRVKEGKTTKTVTEAVPWKDRLTFKKDGFEPIGVNLGLTKVTDSKGNEVNDKKRMFEYDACKYIGDNLKDDESVFVRGKLEFSTYNDKHQIRFVPNQISLCKPIDFDAENYQPIGNFEQVIVFMGIQKNDDNFTVEAKIVTFNSVEDVEFIVENPKLAKNLKSLKPYTAIKVFGDIRVEFDTEIVEDEDDGWGTPNPMERVNSPATRSLVITGADKGSIDTEVYSEEAIEAAIAKTKSEKTANKDYGEEVEDDGWGSASTLKSSGSEDEDVW